MRLAWSFALVVVLALGPAVAQAQPLYVPGVRVAVAPPPLRVEVQPVRPSPGHIWIAGHWTWRGNAHSWIGGHWAVPPSPGYVWEPARWVSEGGQWMFYEGHWRNPTPPAPTVVYDPPPVQQEVVVETAPPAPIVEVRSAAPFGGAVWIPGYWHWNGMRHVWVGGHWSGPRNGFTWVAHHWEPRGPRWVAVPGHWQRR